MLNATLLTKSYSVDRNGYLLQQPTRLLFDDIKIKVPKVSKLQRQGNVFLKLLVNALSENVINNLMVTLMTDFLGIIHR